jgi:hypothetical protein
MWDNGTAWGLENARPGGRAVVRLSRAAGFVALLKRARLRLIQNSMSRVITILNRYFDSDAFDDFMTEHNPPVLLINIAYIQSVGSRPIAFIRIQATSNDVLRR